MKAASLLRHIWVGCLISLFFLAATGVAFAGVANGGGEGKTTAKQEVLQQNDGSEKKKAELNKAENGATPAKNEAKTTAANQREVKKESATSFFSFSFLYYLFYKTNFAETTNTAMRKTWSSVLSSIFN